MPKITKKAVTTTTTTTAAAAKTVKKVAPAKAAAPVKKVAKVTAEPAVVKTSAKVTKETVTAKKAGAVSRKATTTTKPKVSLFKTPKKDTTPKVEGKQRTFETFVFNVRERLMDELSLDGLTLEGTNRITKCIVAEIRKTIEDGKSLRLDKDMFITVRDIAARVTKAPMASTETLVAAHKEAKMRVIPGGIDAIKFQGELISDTEFKDVDGNIHILNEEEEAAEETEVVEVEEEAVEEVEVEDEVENEAEEESEEESSDEDIDSVFDEE